MHVIQPGTSQGSTGNAAAKAGNGFNVCVRGRHVPAAQGVVIHGSTPAEVVARALSLDVSGIEEPVIEWEGTHDVVALDLDRAAGDDPVRTVDIPSLFPDSLPKPAAAWVTHGGGLRAIFVAVAGIVADALAGAWALLAPLARLASWRMEALPRTRHPAGARGNERCGRVVRMSPSTRVVLPGDSKARVSSDDQIESWLHERGLDFGRYPTPNCPLCFTTRKSSGSDPILIDVKGINCFRCHVFRSWDRLLGSDPEHRPSLYRAARAIVHFPHQQFVLRDVRPAVPPTLLQPAWAFVLRAMNFERLAEQHLDAKGRPTDNPWESAVDVASGSSMDLVRSSSGGWLDAATLAPRRVTMVSARALPSSLDAIHVDKALDVVALDGFVPVRPINSDTLLGPYATGNDGAVVVRRPGAFGPPEVSRRPTSTEVEAAWKAAEAALPGLNRGYVCGLVTAVLAAQPGERPPPILVVTGETGTSKTATQLLVGSMVGGGSVTVSLGRDADTTRRSIGLALEQDGASALFVDEISRVPDLYEKLGVILELGTTIRFAAKFANERVVRTTAPLSILGSAMPDAIVKSPELARRSVGWRLTEKARGWNRHGDMARARHDKILRPLLDVITADLWWRVSDLGPTFDWRGLCLKEFGAVDLSGLHVDDVGNEGRNALIVDLYARYRSASEESLTANGRRDGWLNASPGTETHKVLGELVDTDADHRRSRAEIEELGRVDLAEVLGFDEPRLKLAVRRRSARWYVKFLQLGVKKGAEIPRHGLPDVEKGFESPASGRVAPDAPDAPGTSSSETNRTAEGAAGSTASGGMDGGKTNASSATGDAAATGTTSTRRRAAIVAFRARSRASRIEVGGAAYASHPSTEVLCASAWLPDGDIVEWTPPAGLPSALAAHVHAGLPLASHGAQDVARHLWERLGYQAPVEWVDTQQLARLAGLPADLSELAGLLGDQPPADNTDILALSRVDPCTGRLPRIDGPARQRLASGCRDEVALVQRLASTRLRNVGRLEREVRDVDAKINARGFRFDTVLADAVLGLVETEQVNLQEAAGVGGDVLASPSRLQAWLAEAGVVLPDVAHGRLHDLLDDQELPDAVRRVLQARLSSSSIVAHKLRAGLRRVGEDSRIRDSLVYAAAHTGRWGARGFQPQNLPRGRSGIDVPAALSASLAGDLERLREVAREASCSLENVFAALVRPCIQAADGKLLATVDFASIEARALRWLAQDERGLNAFRNGVDLYRAAAASLFAVPSDSVTLAQRQLGKAAELGSGYQMGPERFEVYAESFGVDWAVAGTTPAAAIESWRDANPLIAGAVTGQHESRIIREGGLWRDFERAAKAAARDGTTSEVGRCRWSRKGDDVLCTLPSGRSIVYLSARLEEVERHGRSRWTLTYQRGRRRVQTFGGKLVENATQAVCRDLLADALVRLEHAGHTVVLHVHDEVVAEVASDAEGTAVAEAMRHAPAWAHGLPLAVSCKTAPRYGK